MELNKKNSINNILEENRSFPPSKEFSNSAIIKSKKDLSDLREKARKNPIEFWDSFAKTEIDWFRPYETVLDGNKAPFFKWFPEGQLNITHNCLDRHIKNGLGDKNALIWEGEPCLLYTSPSPRD